MDFLAFFPKISQIQHSIFARLDEKRHYLKEILEKIFKMFLKKIAKMHYFSILFTKFHKAIIPFLRVWTKNDASSKKFLRKFSKILKNFVQKIAKNALF